MKRKLEKLTAVGSFLTAALLAVLSLLLTARNGGTPDISSGTLLTCAQFLTLTATILGVDYKFNS